MSREEAWGAEGWFRGPDGEFRGGAALGSCLGSGSERPAGLEPRPEEGLPSRTLRSSPCAWSPQAFFREQSPAALRAADAGSPGGL